MKPRKTAKQKIAILSGGKGGEREISIKSGRMVADALDRELFQVVEVEIAQNLGLIFRSDKRRLPFLDGLKRLRTPRVDCVFPALHGEFGEDGKLQSVLELLGIPFVGSGSVASCIAMDKGVSRALFLEAGFHVAASYIPKTTDDMSGLKLFFRKGKIYVVKPLNGGSSVGVLITDKKSTIERRAASDIRHGRPVMVEEYLPGREFTCGVLEKGNHVPFAVMPTEIRPKGAAFFDYHAKYAVGGSEEITPPELPTSRIKELQTLAVRAHQLLGCRGMSRSDFILVKDRFYILETNTLPGMTKTSLLPQGAAVCGIDLTELLSLLIRQALMN